jgi:hypothetical protein
MLRAIIPTGLFIASLLPWVCFSDLRIHGLHCAERENVIIMTIGDSQEVKYLHAVKVIAGSGHE